MEVNRLRKDLKNYFQRIEDDVTIDDHLDINSLRDKKKVKRTINLPHQLAEHFFQIQ